MKTKFLPLFFVLLFGKIFLVVALKYLGVDLLVGGNDSEYYDGFALGYVDHATNSWPLILRTLNDLSLYSRGGVTYVLICIAFILIPLCIGSLCKVPISPLKHRVFWASSFIVAAYPTIIFYAMDLYREVFMIFVWVSGLFVFKALSEKTSFLRWIALFLLGFFFSWLLYSLRAYLGFAYFMALMFSSFYSFKRLPLSVLLIVLAVILQILYSAGFLEPIINYRYLFDVTEGGSTIGIQFASTATFLPDLIQSTVTQIFGIHFPNRFSVAAFFLETLPFVCMFVYVVKNRVYSNKFIDFLILFFILYASVWLIGNDNLGTSLRLRIFNYLAILIAFFVIYQNKKLASSVICQSNRKERSPSFIAT